MHDKSAALLAFVSSQKFESVSEKQRKLLKLQLNAMQLYQDILLQRMRDLDSNT